jgi:hypothetical protein
MIAAPEVGGGIDHLADSLSAYLKTKTADRGSLIRYAEEFDNGVIFKRLGYLAEVHLHDNKLGAECRSRLTQGYAQLDPSLPPKKLVTAWRLWLPSARKQSHDRQARNPRSRVVVFAVAQHCASGFGGDQGEANLSTAAV